MNPSSLYKYVPFNALLLGRDEIQEKRQRCFERGEIWYPKPGKLNDPYECYVDFDIALKFGIQDMLVDGFEDVVEGEMEALGTEQGPQFLLTNNENAPVSLNTLGAAFAGCSAALFSSAVLDVGILSLSTDPFDLKMWAHYGGNSTGVCLEFERNKDNILGSAKTNRVNYVKKRLILDHNNRQKCIDKIITTKSIAWKYEKEWRVCETEGDKAYPFPGKIKRILFGLSCADETISLTKNIFGSNVRYENILLGNDYSITSDHGFKQSLSQVKMDWK